MKELTAILNCWGRSSTHEDEAILATVVDVKGSAYRRPGARMLITPDGARFGSVSGGCLEGEIIKKAWWWTESGDPIVRTYDTTADPDTVWELGLGCNGEVRVLLERVGSTEASAQLFSFLETCVQGRIPGAMATVIAAPPGSGASIGAHLFYTGEDSSQGQLLQTKLGPSILTFVKDVLSKQKSKVVQLSDERGIIEIAIEAIVPALPLVVFGAGYDAVPLVQLAKELGWFVTVADGRPSYAVNHRFPTADEVVLTQPNDLLEGVRLNPRSAVVIMNHSYATDREILRRLLSHPVGYVGMLGPRARTEKILAEIGATELPDYFHAPIGLDIGADTPEGISLAIVAEIQAVVSGRDGGKLKFRRAPIYGQEAGTRLTATA